MGCFTQFFFRYSYLHHTLVTEVQLPLLGLALRHLDVHGELGRAPLGDQHLAIGPSWHVEVGLLVELEPVNHRLRLAPPFPDNELIPTDAPPVLVVLGKLADKVAKT